MSITGAGCLSRLNSAPPDEVRIGVDSASAPLAEGLINAYESEYPNTPFSMGEDSRQSIIEAVSNQQFDAAFLLGPLPDRALFATPIALELIVVIVDPSNEIANISLDQLRSILTGHSSDWSSVGGSTVPIILFVPPDESSTRMLIESLILQTNTLTSNARIIADENSLVQWTSLTPGSISYVPYSSLNADVIPLTIDSSSPSPERARQEAYPLLAQIVFVSSSEPQDFIRSFLDWILSSEGQQVVHRYMLGYKD